MQGENLHLKYYPHHLIKGWTCSAMVAPLLQQCLGKEQFSHSLRQGVIIINHLRSLIFFEDFQDDDIYHSAVDSF